MRPKKSTHYAVGTLKREHSKKGITLSMADVLIAAVAIHNQLTLLTFQWLITIELPASFA